MAYTPKRHSVVFLFKVIRARKKTGKGGGLFFGGGGGVLRGGVKI